MTAKADADRHRARMVRAMARDGLLTDPRWRAAFAEVPRHEFLPRFFRPLNAGAWIPVDHTDAAWLTEIYDNRVLVIQLDGNPDGWEHAVRMGEIGGVPTSSSSMPGIMAVMLEALELTDGHRVLEIGTGTGYNAALLCHRLGDSLVSTVDIDEALVDTARERLAAVGFRPTCVATDGALGYPPNAPYDRVLATCAVSRIPLPWLDQTRPGGLIVSTLNRPLGAGLVRITAGDGPCGTGAVLADDGRFMPLRADRIPIDQATIAALVDAEGPTRPTALGASMVVSAASPFEFFAGLDLPGVVPTTLTSHLTLLAHADGSWVRHVTHRGRHEVTQGGPRALWDEVEDSYSRWLELDQPQRSRFGISVDPGGQKLWLDRPDGPYQWAL
jgi:methyltransferase of ATP-grasp peptide maturase system